MRKALAVFVMGIILSACSNYVYDLQGKFQESSTYYNNMIRWNELGKAGYLLADSQRETSLPRLQAAANIRVVDSRIINTTFLEEKRKATIEVEIDYYFLNSTKVKTLRDKQEWAYIQEQGAPGWRVTSPIPDFK